VIEHQLTTVGDVGSVERGDTLTAKVPTLDAHLMFRTRALPNADVPPGSGTQRLCLSMETPEGDRHYRQFMLEVIGYDEPAREVSVRLYVSNVLTEAECRQVTLDTVAHREIDTSFGVGLFDFPMIDTTRLSSGERVSVSLTALNPDVLTLVVAYFPASRASLKDKPYYDEVTRLLVRGRQSRD
jgi:hypothetical protein